MGDRYRGDVGGRHTPDTSTPSVTRPVPLSSILSPTPTLPPYLGSPPDDVRTPVSNRRRGVFRGMGDVSGSESVVPSYGNLV